MTPEEHREAAVTVRWPDTPPADPAPVDQLAARVSHALIVGDSEERTEAVRDLLEGWYAAWPETAVTDEHEPLAGLLVRLFDGRLARVERERDEALATDRPEIARQIAELADNETALLGWLSTCNPQPITVPTVLRALAGMIGAGQPAAPEEPADWLYDIGSEYIPDPVERIATVAEVAPEYVRPAPAEPKPERGHGGRCPNPDADPDARDHRCPGSRS